MIKCFGFQHSLPISVLGTNSPLQITVAISAVSLLFGARLIQGLPVWPLSYLGRRKVVRHL